MAYTYKIAQPEDYPKLQEFIKDYITACDLEQMGGHWAIAKNDGEIKASVWFFGEHPNVYIDYWIGTSKIAAGKLLFNLEASLRLLGIKYVRAVTHISNTHVKEQLSKWRGAAFVDDYTFICKELINSGPENNTDHNNSRSRGN
jgi:hypothetical protein